MCLGKGDWGRRTPTTQPKSAHVCGSLVPSHQRWAPHCCHPGSWAGLSWLLLMKSVVEGTLSGVPSLVRKVPSLCLPLLGSRHMPWGNPDCVASGLSPGRSQATGVQEPARDWRAFCDSSPAFGVPADVLRGRDELSRQSPIQIADLCAE